MISELNIIFDDLNVVELLRSYWQPCFKFSFIFSQPLHIFYGDVHFQLGNSVTSYAVKGYRLFLADGDKIDVYGLSVDLDTILVKQIKRLSTDNTNGEDITTFKMYDKFVTIIKYIPQLMVDWNRPNHTSLSINGDKLYICAWNIRIYDVNTYELLSRKCSIPSYTPKINHKNFFYSRSWDGICLMDCDTTVSETISDITSKATGRFGERIYSCSTPDFLVSDTLLCCVGHNTVLIIDLESKTITHRLPIRSKVHQMTLVKGSLTVLYQNSEVDSCSITTTTTIKYPQDVSKLFLVDDEIIIIE